jgi:hypothetical protein
MKNIKKTAALSLVTISFLSFGIHIEPVQAQNFLTRLLFPYVKPPSMVKDFDKRFGKVPPKSQDYDPNSSSPYGYYGNELEGLMGRDIRELIELDRLVNKRPPQTTADPDTLARYWQLKPIGDLKKSIPLEDGNIAYMFYDWGGGRNGTPGTPDQMVTQYTPYGGGNSYIVSGTPGTPSSVPWNCTTYLIADPNGKLFYWSYKGSSDSIDDCSSDMRRLK